MPVLTQTFRESSLTDLASAINTWLATRVGGSAILLLYADVIQNLLPRRMLKQAEFQAILTYNTTPVGAQAQPFVFQTAAAGNPDDLETALNAIAATVGLNFISGFRVISQDEPSQIPQMLAWGLTSTDAGASANYTPR